MPEFIAFGMATEIIVVIQNQDPRIGTILFAIEIGGSQSTDTTANNDQVIVALARIDCLPGTAVAHGVGNLERADMASAQTLSSRWIVVRRQSRSIQ